MISVEDIKSVLKFPDIVNEPRMSKYFGESLSDLTHSQKGLFTSNLSEAIEDVYNTTNVSIKWTKENIRIYDQHRFLVFRCDIKWYFSLLTIVSNIAKFESLKSIFENSNIFFKAFEANKNLYKVTRLMNSESKANESRFIIFNVTFLLLMGMDINLSSTLRKLITNCVEYGASYVRLVNTNSLVLDCDKIIPISYIGSVYLAVAITDKTKTTSYEFYTVNNCTIVTDVQLISSLESKMSITRD